MVVLRVIVTVVMFTAVTSLAACGSTHPTFAPADAGSELANPLTDAFPSPDGASIEDGAIDSSGELDVPDADDDATTPNGPDCPPATTTNPIPIVQHSACTVPGTVCHYPATQCVCMAVDGSEAEWQCTHIIQ